MKIRFAVGDNIWEIGIVPCECDERLKFDRIETFDVSHPTFLFQEMVDDSIVIRY